MHIFLEIKSPKNECWRFSSTFANFEKNKNRQTFWICISKTTHPKVSFSKIKWNLIFWFCPAILDPCCAKLLSINFFKKNKAGNNLLVYYLFKRVAFIFVFLIMLMIQTIKLQRKK